MHESFIQRLPPPVQTWLDQRCTTRNLRTGDILFRQGDEAETLYFVQSGRVAIEVAGPNGATSVLRIADQGSVIGEFVIVVPGLRRSATGVALEPTRVRMLHRADFQEARNRWPTIDQALVTDLALRLISVGDSAVIDHHSPLRQRIVHRLLAVDASQGGGWIVISQQQLAQMVGCSRQAVNITLNEAEAADLVRLKRGKVEVVDRDGLQRWADRG